MFDEFLYTTRSDIENIGLRCSVMIPGNSPITDLTTDLFTQSYVKANAKRELFCQVGPNAWVEPNGILDFINHSCSPNAFVKVGRDANQYILYSLTDIPPDTEITFDYSLTETESLEDFTMECRCGAPNCRGIISGLQYVPVDVVRAYADLGIVPYYQAQDASCDASF